MELNEGRMSETMTAAQMDEELTKRSDWLREEVSAVLAEAVNEVDEGRADQNVARLAFAFYYGALSANHVLLNGPGAGHDVTTMMAALVGAKLPD